jgi:hypothetical protein
MKATILALSLGALLLTGCQSMSAPEKPAAVVDDPAAPVALKRFLEANGAVLAELGDIKTNGKQNLELTQKTQETAQRTLAALEELSRRHGTGEITVFFPVSSAALSTAERDRLVRFTDFAAREARGRKLLLVSIGSASAFGNQKVNQRLAERRSAVPIDVMDKYLINVPHEFHKVYGTGDLYSPKGVKLKEHERYQNARVIAVFASEQLPGNINAGQ